MIDAEIFLGKLYKSLAQDDPEKQAVQGLLLSTQAFNSKTVGQPVASAEVSAQLPQPESQRRIDIAMVYPEISPEEEAQRQRFIIAEGIGKNLGMSEAECLAQLPDRFPEKPTNTELAQTTPLIVPKFKGYSWLQVAEAAGLYVSDNFRERIAKGELGQWTDQREDIEPDPEVPFSAWFQDGSRYVKKSPNYTRGHMHQLERAGDHWGGIGLEALRPDMVQTMGWDLIGGQVGRDHVPYASQWGGRLGFYYRLAGGAIPFFRSLLRWE